MTVAVAAPPDDRPRTGRTIVGASAPGASHVRRGAPCQDAFCVLEHGSAFAIAVADGLGSAARSELGADIATVAAATRALRFARDDPVVGAIEAMLAARDALETAANDRSIELRELGCTLMVVAGNDDRIGVAHIGDGGIVGRVSDEWHVLSPPAESEYLNETDPITARDWERRVRWTGAAAPLDALALFTDGCQHAGLRRDDNILRAHDGFFAPLIGFVGGGVDELDAAMALRKLLAGRKLGEHSDDDKTLVLAVL